MAKSIAELNRELQSKMGVLNKGIALNRKASNIRKTFELLREEQVRLQQLYQSLQVIIDDLYKAIEEAPDNTKLVDLRRSEYLLKIVEERKKQLEGGDKEIATETRI